MRREAKLDFDLDQAFLSDGGVQLHAVMSRSSPREATQAAGS